MNAAAVAAEARLKANGMSVTELRAALAEKKVDSRTAIEKVGLFSPSVMWRESYNCDTLALLSPNFYGIFSSYVLSYDGCTRPT